MLGDGVKSFKIVFLCVKLFDGGCYLAFEGVATLVQVMIIQLKGNFLTAPSKLLA